MVVTIAIDEPLASRLQAQAAARQVSPEECARALLGEALQHMDDSEAWEVQNQRRIELIRKSAVETLTEAEQAELQSLQDAADRRLEERDWALLTQLDRLKRAIEQRASEARCAPAGTTAPGACTPRVQRVRWGMAKTPGGTLPRCWRKSADVSLRIGVVKGAFIDFCNCHKAYTNVFRIKALYVFCYVFFSCQEVNDPVSIKNVSHYGRVAPRDPSSLKR